MTDTDSRSSPDPKRTEVTPPDPTIPPEQAAANARFEVRTARYKAIAESLGTCGAIWRLESGDRLEDPMADDFGFADARAARSLWLQSAFEAMRRIADES